MAYTARIDAQMSLEKILANHEHRDFIIPFVCQPFKHLVTPASNIEITASGGTITNPGTVASLPIILVEGTGTIGLTIGGTAIEIDGSANGIIIDCTIPDCFSFDRSVLMNSYMTGEFPTIPPGTSYVTWTGTVTKVTITPNWRWL
jgi:phage-related protein